MDEPVAPSADGRRPFPGTIGLETRFKPGNKVGDTPVEMKAVAVAVVESGSTHKEAAQLYGMDRSTVTRWTHGERNPPPAEVVDDAKERLAKECERAAFAIMGSIGRMTADELDRVPLRDKARALAELADRMQKLRGDGDTVNVKHSLADYLAQRVS